MSKPEYLPISMPDHDGRIVISDPQTGKQAIIEVKDGKSQVLAKDLPLILKLNPQALDR